MKSLKSLVQAVLLALALVCATPARANNSGAVLLVNSHSTNYLDYVHFIQPYLSQFGVPYSVIDISSNAVNTNLTNYALIIIGHSLLDSNHVYLNSTAQSNISWAVSNGVGLVSFDNVLASNNVPLYQFEQNIFGLGFTSSHTGDAVEFPANQPLSTMHYITALHVTNETLTLSNADTGLTAQTIAGFTTPTNVTSVATCGGVPFVMITKYGQGRAVQWAGYQWMSSAIQGPIDDLDDLVWRGFVWAARKPFVMRGFPHLATMRIDDVCGTYGGPAAPPEGPLFWVHDMVSVGFKPYLALFITDLWHASYIYPADGRIADLRNMATNGQVTCNVHSGSANSDDFFFFNHQTESAYDDVTMSNKYVSGSQFMQTNGLPMSPLAIAHYSEVGTNAFTGMTNLGINIFLIEIVPGTIEYPSSGPGAPWLVAGPYRLYEPTQPGQVNNAMYYADWLPIPGHPELNGKYFDVYTEIRNVGDQGEWAPDSSDIPGSIQRGYQMLKRGFDSMILGNIFTHEFYIQPSDGPPYGNFSSSSFLTVMQGITNLIAPYNPTYVTLDYGSKYARATRTSSILSADYDPSSGKITANFSGYVDMPITAYYYTGVDNSITNIAGTVPVFSGSTNVTLGAISAPVQLLTPSYQQGKLVFTLTGQVGSNYSIEGRTNVATGTWVSLQTVTLTNGPVVVKIPTTNKTQFVHARLLP